jgi:hypothetical protein
MGSKHSALPKEDNQSKLAIDSFVNLLMQNKHINCTYMPDFIERDIYRNIIIVLLANLREWIRTVRIEILHHVITMNIEPLSSSPPEKKDDPLPMD